METKDILNKINERRKKKKISVQELADGIGMSYRYIYLVLHHMTNPSIENLKKIVDFLGMKLYVK